MVNTMRHYETNDNDLEEMGVKLKLSKIKHNNHEQIVFKDRISSFKYKISDFDTTLKRLDIFDIPKDEIHSMIDFSLSMSHLLCVLPFFLISVYFYKCHMNMNAYLHEVRLSQLKLLILNIRLHQQANDSNRFIDFYRTACIKWKERAEVSEGLIKRYNNVACKNESFEKKLLQMEDFEINAMLQDIGTLYHE